KVISDNVALDRLKNSHLLVTATNFMTGELETFGISAHLKTFLEQDDANGTDNRRLRGYTIISSQEDLHNCLLASAAIPFFLPPITINGQMYVDGGVGNNTALSQAALFARYLHQFTDHACDVIVCNLLDSERFVLPQDYPFDMAAVVQRTLD